MTILAFVESRKVHRSGQWHPIRDNDDWEGRVFCVMMSPIVGILWAWRVPVERWAKWQLGEGPQ